MTYDTRNMPSCIEDYAILGDCQSVALVGKDGSIDWLCLPYFDSGACFAALLGGPDNGRWQICPEGEVRSVRRRYQDDTLILETEFTTDQGSVLLVDLGHGLASSRLRGEERRAARPSTSRSA